MRICGSTLARSVAHVHIKMNMLRPLSDRVDCPDKYHRAHTLTRISLQHFLIAMKILVLKAGVHTSHSKLYSPSPALALSAAQHFSTYKRVGEWRAKARMQPS